MSERSLRVESGTNRRQSVAARLQDKVAILTGAASGIGEAVARRYLDEGAQCVLVDVKPADKHARIGLARAKQTPKKVSRPKRRRRGRR